MYFFFLMTEVIFSLAASFWQQRTNNQILNNQTKYYDTIPSPSNSPIPQDRQQ